MASYDSKAEQNPATKAIAEIKEQVQLVLYLRLMREGRLESIWDLRALRGLHYIWGLLQKNRPRATTGAERIYPSSFLRLNTGIIAAKMNRSNIDIP